jgi:hypothetical protein
MTQTLFTNNASTTGKKFKIEFKERLIHSKNITIASGYFGASSIIEYKDDLIKVAHRGQVKILIGMIFHGGVTKKQEEVLIDLDNNLRDISPDNGVYVSIKPYHGKIYLFDEQLTPDSKHLYLGSSNFSEEGLATRNECTALITNQDTKDAVTEYLAHLFNTKQAKPLNAVELRVKSTVATTPAPSKLLKDYKIDATDFPSSSPVIGICEITLRVDDQPASSLNLYFDKGRKNQKGLYAPRPWYEVEITSNTSDRENPFYPQSELKPGSDKSRSGEFIAYAEDDGAYYKFNMGVYSDNGKAISTLASSGGRSTLGKFIKGKLERAGLLSEGDVITSDILLAYGRTSILFKKISANEYIMEF